MNTVRCSSVQAGDAADAGRPKPVTRARKGSCRASDQFADRLHVVSGVRRPGVLVDHAHQPSPHGEAMMSDSQRLSDTEQLEILALLDAASTERSAMGAARALAQLIGHLHALGQRIAGGPADQDRHHIKRAGR
jgi:hypothetical protein